jgi:hypothetical protein
MTRIEFLRSVCPSTAVIDRFLDENTARWARFDPEVGYVPNDSVMQDGLNGSWSRYSYEPDGARRCLCYSDRPSRIHTYGDSFTQCHQVSDHETWQEYLAGHLGEPIRNYGVGGHGVYQAWLRMRRHEARSDEASLLVLNIYLDDHRRNVMPCRLLHIPAVLAAVERDVAASAPVALFFHSNPWSHLKPDPVSGGCHEVPNPLDTPTRLYELCSPDAIEALFGRSLSFHVALIEQGVKDADLQLIRTHGEAVGIALETNDAEHLRASAQRIQFVWGMRATQWVVEQARTFAESKGRQLLILLSHPQRAALNDLAGLPRPDQALLDHLEQLGQKRLDSRDLHGAEHRTLGGNAAGLIAKYLIGHYSPQGNHFFAYAIRETVVGCLQPPPPAYAGSIAGTAGSLAPRMA